MPIVDAQVHIWSSGKPTNPNHRQVPVFSKDDLLKEMDEAGVDAALIHPPALGSDSNELAVEAARQHPDRLAILGNFPLDQPESRALIDGWKSRPGMLGLRFTFLQPHQKTWPTDGTIDWLWPAAERAGIPVALLAGSFLPEVGQVAERHPRLKLIIDHLGRPSGTKDAPRGPTSTSCWRWRSIRTSPSRPPARRAIRASPIRIATSTATCARSTTRSAPSACSGAPTSRGCRARGGSA